MAKEYKYETIDFTYESRRYKARGKTKEEAEANKKARIAEMDAGKAAYSQNKSIVFKDYATRWSNTFNRGISKTSRKDIEARLNNHIIPNIGHLRMKDITRSDLIDMLNAMSGMSRDRILKIRQTTTRILQAAYDDGYLPKIPVIRNTDMPDSKEAAPRRAITPFERALTLKVAEHHIGGGYVLTMLYCGLRPQEVAALQGRHIDFKKMQIAVEQSRKRDDTIGKPKTEKGKRIVPIPPQLLPYLPKVDPFEYVFKSSGRMLKGRKRKPGHFLNLGNSRRLWESFKRAMNEVAGAPVYGNSLIPCMEAIDGCSRGCMQILPDYIRDGIGKRNYPVADDLTPYLYRHTFGCDCATAGVDIDLLAKLMGHANISITSKFYLHMTDDRMEKAANLISSYHAIQDQKLIAI